MNARWREAHMRLMTDGRQVCGQETVQVITIVRDDRCPPIFIHVQRLLIPGD